MLGSLRAGHQAVRRSSPAHLCSSIHWFDFQVSHFPHHKVRSQRSLRPKKTEAFALWGSLSITAGHGRTGAERCRRARYENGERLRRYLRNAERPAFEGGGSAPGRAASTSEASGTTSTLGHSARNWATASGGTATTTMRPASSASRAPAVSPCCVSAFCQLTANPRFLSISRNTRRGTPLCSLSCSQALVCRRAGNSRRGSPA